MILIFKWYVFKETESLQFCKTVYTHVIAENHQLCVLYKLYLSCITNLKITSMSLYIKQGPFVWWRFNLIPRRLQWLSYLSLVLYDAFSNVILPLPTWSYARWRNKLNWMCMGCELIKNDLWPWLWLLPSNRLKSLPNTFKRQFSYSVCELHMLVSQMSCYHLL